jgi:predicted ATPase
MPLTGLSILTGAPGSGKTAILEHVGDEIRVVGEPAREVLEEQRSTGGAGTHDRDPALFVELLLQRSIEKYEAARRWEGSVAFDRGVPDCIAYAVVMGTDPAPSIEASKVYRYRNEVLVLEPWAEIYTVDDERTMSFGATMEFHDAIVEAYERTGYTRVQVPRGSVEERASFVHDFVTHQSA